MMEAGVDRKVVLAALASWVGVNQISFSFLCDHHTMYHIRSLLNDLFFSLVNSFTTIIAMVSISILLTFVHRRLRHEHYKELREYYHEQMTCVLNI